MRSFFLYLNEFDDTDTGNVSTERTKFMSNAFPVFVQYHNSCNSDKKEWKSKMAYKNIIIEGPFTHSVGLRAVIKIGR